MSNFQTRPLGDPSLKPRKYNKRTVRPQFANFVTNQEREDFVRWVMENYQKDIVLAKWVGDQVFGRALISISASDSIPFEGDDETKKKIASARAQILGAGASVVEVLSEDEAEEKMAENFDT